MQYKIFPPENIDATVGLTSSKSISNRALIIHALAGGAFSGNDKADVLPANLSVCDDTTVLLNALRDMPDVIDIGASGTAMRFLTAYLAVTPGEHVLTGNERMQQRPIGELVDALRYFGADIEYVGNAGFPPLRIRGRKLDGGHVKIAGNISSQFISAMLMIGPTLKNGLSLHLTTTTVSRSYIDLTLWAMSEYGAEAEWTDVDTITVSPKPYKLCPYIIENDWTAASYWYAISLLLNNRTSRIVMKGLMDGSKQGDSVVKYIFNLMGVRTAFKSRTSNKPTDVLLTTRPCTLPRLEYNFVNSPDLAQTLIATCCALEIPFRFTGVQSLHIKETDRVEAMKTEMRKLGLVLHNDNDNDIYWDGEKCQPSLEPIDTYDDHRTAMAFAPLAVKHPGLTIRDPEVVSKSYPKFWDDMRTAGFRIEEI